MNSYGPRGLALIAPTRLYGYVGGGLEAPPVVEKRYIERVLQQYYPMLGGVPIPVSASSFMDYGASTTPTLVLIDAAGTVGFYHPGAMTQQELSAQISRVLEK